MQAQQDSKPLIAILTNHDDDIYCFRLELIQAFLARGYRLLISCPDGPKLKLMSRRYGIRKKRDYFYDNPCIDRRGINPINDGKLFLHYIHLFRKFRPDIVLTYTAKPNVYAGFAAHILGIPIISNVTGFGSVADIHGFRGHLIMSLFRSAFRYSSCMMFQNRVNMQYALDHGFVKGDYRLIPGSGVTPDRYPLQPYPEGGDGLTGPTVIFNYIGRILKDKGVDDYLEAARRIRQKYPQTEFNLIGFIEPTEDHYQQILRECQEQSIAIYRGAQDDILPWIRRSHAVIHPSIYGEGLSNVLLENASCGRPIITTDNPGCRETVNDGETGFIYHGRNIDELTAKMEYFLSNMSNTERETMGKKGREKVTAEFNRDSVKQVYLEEIAKHIRE